MKVIIGYPHGSEVAFCFHDSLIRAITELGPEVIAGIQAVSAGAMGLDRARNEICERFLATEEKWLLFIDADMQFEPSDVLALLKAADNKSRPVVGGLCFMLKGMNEEYGPVLAPTMFKGLDHIMAYKGLQKCDATGAAFLLIHRSVLEKIGENWFSHHPTQDTQSEDWAFCRRLKDNDVPLFVDTTVKIGHQKDVILSERDYLLLVDRLRREGVTEAPR